MIAGKVAGNLASGIVPDDKLLAFMFEDAVQSELPDFQKRKGLQVHHSNLCSEITLATDEERTAVCCLSSVNL